MCAAGAECAGGAECAVWRRRSAPAPAQKCAGDGAKVRRGRRRKRRTFARTKYAFCMVFRAPPPAQTAARPARPPAAYGAHPAPPEPENGAPRARKAEFSSKSHHIQQHVVTTCSGCPFLRKPSLCYRVKDAMRRAFLPAHRRASPPLTPSRRRRLSPRMQRRPVRPVWREPPSRRRVGAGGSVSDRRDHPELLRRVPRRCDRAAVQRVELPDGRRIQPSTCARRGRRRSRRGGRERGAGAARGVWSPPRCEARRGARRRGGRAVGVLGGYRRDAGVGARALAAAPRARAAALARDRLALRPAGRRAARA